MPTHVQFRLMALEISPNLDMDCRDGSCSARVFTRRWKLIQRRREVHKRTRTAHLGYSLDGRCRVDDTEHRLIYAVHQQKDS